MDLATARSELNDLAQLDVTTAEADRVLNEAHRKLATLSEWTRAELELGPTVADQADYALPATVHRVLEIDVNGVTFLESSRREVRNLRNGLSRVRGPSGSGAYYLSFSAAGAERITIYPTPGSASAGLAISALVVRVPVLLTDPTDTFETPETFDRAIIDYATGILVAAEDDADDRRTAYERAFLSQVADLRALRLSKQGRSVGTAKIRGRNV